MPSFRLLEGVASVEGITVTDGSGDEDPESGLGADPFLIETWYVGGTNPLTEVGDIEGTVGALVTGVARAVLDKTDSIDGKSVREKENKGEKGDCRCKEAGKERMRGKRKKGNGGMIYKP
jgi:hypothetical protein